MKTSRIAIVAAVMLALGSLSALAGNTQFFTSKNGDVTFPLSPPANGQPGALDNTAIGATTPAPGHFTDFSYTGSASGAGNTANFASPPPLGSTAPNSVVGTTVTSTGLSSDASLQVDTGTKTASATAGAATLNKNAGVITSEALTTAGLASYTLTLTDSAIAAADQVTWSVANGTNTQGTPVQGTATPGAGSVVIVVYNAHPTQALNGTLKIAFVVHKN